MPRSNPTEAQRHHMQGHHPNSIMGRATTAERRRIEELKKRDREDRAVFERSLYYGSQPRRG